MTESEDDAERAEAAAVPLPRTVGRGSHGRLGGHDGDAGGEPVHSAGRLRDGAGPGPVGSRSGR